MRNVIDPIQCSSAQADAFANSPHSTCANRATRGPEESGASAGYNHAALGTEAASASAAPRSALPRLRTRLAGSPDRPAAHRLGTTGTPGRASRQAPGATSLPTRPWILEQQSATLSTRLSCSGYASTCRGQFGTATRRADGSPASYGDMTLKSVPSRCASRTSSTSTISRTCLGKRSLLGTVPMAESAGEPAILHRLDELPLVRAPRGTQPQGGAHYTSPAFASRPSPRPPRARPRLRMCPHALSKPPCARRCPRARVRLQA